MGEQQFMPHTECSLLLRHLRRICGTPGSADTSDADLLTRFATARDEAAFELLLWRHATMVLSVCYDVTRDEQLAEDAFQATFFALVQKAGAIRDRQSLGAWLYRVAYRVALRARSHKLKRAARERYDIDLPSLAATAESPDETVLSEMRSLLHEQVQRLPLKYRLPIVLCHLEGLTHDEAARQLGWPKGTVSGRLSRARDLLGKRLCRRSATLPAALAALTLATPPASAIVPATLVRTTLRAGLLIAMGRAIIDTAPASVAALTKGVLQAMFWTKVRLTTSWLLALGLVGGGIGLVARGGLIAQPAPLESAAVAAQDTPAVQSQPAGPEPAQGVAKKSVADQGALSEARKQSILSLRQIALAMHNYLGTTGSFPPPAIYSKAGKPLLSWRVALLPYLNQNNLYRQFRLDEPWDGPHNKKLLAYTLKVYQIPGSKDRTSTYYQVFVGQDTIFEQRRSGRESRATIGMGGGGAPAPGNDEANTGAVSREPAGMGIADIPDGLSNTILVIEGGSPVPWTKPEDLAYAATGRIPPLGGAIPDAIYAAFADGAVYALKRQYDEHTLRLAITRNDGQPFDLAALIAPGTDFLQLKEDINRLRRELDEARAEVRQGRDELRQLQQFLDQRRVLPVEVKDDTLTDPLRGERKRLRLELAQAREEAKRLADRIQQLKRDETATEPGNK
jgi:RNA polymerase sigma factor (sigma-70 family)